MRSTDTDTPASPASPTLAQRLLGLYGHRLRRPWPRRALVAMALALLAGYGTLALGSLAERNIFMLAFLAVAAAGLYGGFGGGVVATVTGALFASYMLIQPIGSLHVAAAQDRVRLGALLAAGMVIAVLCETLHRAFRQLMQREAALRESEESYRTLFDTLTELVHIHDLKGRFLDLNRAVVDAYGYAREELLGQTPLLLVDPERTRLATLLTLVRHAAAGTPQRFECWGRRRDGTSFPKELTLMRGRYFGRDVLIAVGRDISSRKSAETALADSQEQLRQAQKLEAIGRLAGGVAHDFNNLLTAIKGNAELAALELAPGSPAHTELVEISATADRATSLTRQLLAFSRKQVRQPRVLDLNVVLKDMERMLRRVIGSDVELITEPAASPACVCADAGQLEQVILNLVVNARDAVPRGGTVRIEVGEGVLPERGSRAACAAVRLAVHDNGSGIPEDVLEHIFEPFFTTKAQGKGTGLGLSTVYGIIQQSGGEVEVDTSAGRGTCFRVLLPRAADAPLAGAEVRAATAGKAGPAGTGTILLVEDDAVVRSLTERILRRGGYRVLSAAGGQQAVAILEQGQVTPDLLLTDVLMPEMSGPELAARLREELPGLPVLFVSGYAADTMPSTGSPGLEAPLLEKPFTAAALLQQVAARIAARAA